MHWRGFQFAAGRARMRAHAQKAQREKARIWGRAKRRTSDNKKARPLGVLAQENIGFGLTILLPSAFKKPGNPSGLPGFFHATIHPKLPGRPLAAKSTAAIASRTGSLLKSSAGTFAAMGSRKTASGAMVSCASAPKASAFLLLHARAGAFLRPCGLLCAAGALIFARRARGRARCLRRRNRRKFLSCAAPASHGRGSGRRSGRSPRTPRPFCPGWHSGFSPGRPRRGPGRNIC